MVDEAGALQNGLMNTYGAEVQIYISSCTAHFMSAAIRNSKRGIGNADDVEEFLLLAKQLMESDTSLSYNNSFRKMQNFIDDDIQNRSFLRHWLGWWHNRRFNWCFAFKPESAPSTNLSEVAHSRDKSRGSYNVSVSQAMRDDIIQFVELRNKFQLYSEGIYMEVLVLLLFN